MLLWVERKAYVSSSNSAVVSNNSQQHIGYTVVCYRTCTRMYQDILWCVVGHVPGYTVVCTVQIASSAECDVFILELNANRALGTVCEGRFVV